MKCRLLEDPGLGDRIAAHVEQGSTLEGAAELEGIWPSQISTWVRKGVGTHSKKSEPYRLFAEKLARANAALENDVASHVKVLANLDGHIGLKFLERRFPKRWGNQTTVKVEFAGYLDRLIEALRAGLTEPEFAKVCAIAARFEMDAGDPVASGQVAGLLGE